MLAPDPRLQAQEAARQAEQKAQQAEQKAQQAVWLHEARQERVGAGLRQINSLSGHANKIVRLESELQKLVEANPELKETYSAYQEALQKASTLKVHVQLALLDGIRGGYPLQTGVRISAESMTYREMIHQLIPAYKVFLAELAQLATADKVSISEVQRFIQPDLNKELEKLKKHYNL